MTRQEPPAKPLTESQKAELLRVKAKDLSISTIAKLFGYTTGSGSGDKKNAFTINEPTFNLRSKFSLKANEYTNKEEVHTSVGIFLFNKLMVEGNLESVVPNGYLNEVISKKKFGDFTSLVASAVMSEKIPVKPTLVEFLRSYEFWGLGLVTIFSPSFSRETIMPNKELLAKKKELLDENPNATLAEMVDIEDKLTTEADRLTKGSAGKYLFDSGARGSFENDFKNMSISIGPVENPITKEYDFIKSNYTTGIAKSDLAAAANITVGAEYPKAIGTAQGGYITKQMNAVFQTVVLDEDGTDCGTTEGLTVTLDKSSYKEYIDQYIIDGKKLVLITEDLPVSYLNHPIKVRSTMYCTSEKLCSKCAGRRFYKVGIDTIGLTTPAMSGSMMNANLKLRHSMKIKMDHVDLDDLLV